MRIVTIVVAAAVGAAPAHAWADDRADLQTRGEQLAKEGRFGDAIEAFKAADRIQPRASHACLIALAYTRRELWPQAELFLSICHQRAKDGDPLPDWVPLADQQMKERLQAAGVVEVTIDVKPANAPARVTVSSFAPDEVFESRTIHLPLGTHVIFARAEGYPDAQYTLDIKDKTPQRVEIDLAATRKPEALPASPPAATGGRPGLTKLYIGAAAAVLGGITHAWMGWERSQLLEANETGNQSLYDDHSTRFDVAKYTTIGLYTVGAGLLVWGLLERRGGSEHAAVSAAPLPEGGALVSVGWQR